MTTAIMTKEEIAKLVKKIMDEMQKIFKEIQESPIDEYGFGLINDVSAYGTKEKLLKVLGNINNLIASLEYITKNHDEILHNFIASKIKLFIDSKQIEIFKQAIKNLIKNGGGQENIKNLKKEFLQNFKSYLYNGKELSNEMDTSEIDQQLDVTIDSLVNDAVFEEYTENYLSSDIEKKAMVLFNFSKDNSFNITEEEIESYVNKFLKQAYLNEYGDTNFDEKKMQEVIIKHSLFIELLKQKVRSKKSQQQNDSILVNILNNALTENAVSQSITSKKMKMPTLGFGGF